MAGTKPKIYVDSGLIIAWAHNENRGEGQLIYQIMNREIIPVSSVILRAEVLESLIPPDKIELVKRVISPPQMQIKTVCSRVADLAEEMRGFVHAERETRRDLPKLELGDALHLATAVHYGCEGFVTLDGVSPTGRKRQLLLWAPAMRARYGLEMSPPQSSQMAWSM